MESLDPQGQPAEQSALKPAKKLDLGRLFDGFGRKKAESAVPAVPAGNSADTLHAPARAQTVVSESSWQQPPDALRDQAVAPAPQLEPEPPAWLRQSAMPGSDSLFAVPAPVDEAPSVPAPKLVIDNDLSAKTPENDSLRARAREDFKRKGYTFVGNDEKGTEIWYSVKDGRGEINPTVTSEHQEKQHDEWFDQTLEAAKTPENAVQALESKLAELEERAGEKAKKVDSVEAERDRLRAEMAAIEKTAKERLPKGKSPSSVLRAEYLNKIRARYGEIQNRLEVINGTDDQVGELDSSREELGVEGSAQKGRRLRKIRQIRGEMEKFQEVIDNPILLDEYRRLRSGMDSVTTNAYLPSAAVEAYRRETEERLLELESQLPAELVKLVKAEFHPAPQQFDTEARDVSTSAIEKAGAFEENVAYGKAVTKLKELIENKLNEIKLNPPVSEPETATPSGETGADQTERIRVLEERITILSTENLALKGGAVSVEASESAVVNQLSPEVQQRLNEVGEISPTDRQQGRDLEAQIESMLAGGTRNGEISKRLSETIKALPEQDQDAARNSLQRQLMARSMEIQADNTLTPDEKSKKISSLRDVAKGVAETGELVFPGLEGMFDFLMKNIVDSLNATK